MSIRITTTNGYMALDAWVMASIIQLLTEEFCAAFVSGAKDAAWFDPTGRQYDQMTQAARSGVANIAEGVSRHQTSRETEMKLLDVARASLQELRGDYFHFLLSRRLAPWTRDSKEFAVVAKTKMEHPHYTTADWDSEAAQFILTQKAKFDRFFRRDDAVTTARVMFILCSRAAMMLDGLIARKLDAFRADGGFAENLTQERVKVKSVKSATDGAPKCPVCGAPMIEQVCKRGVRAGRRFWSCSNYHTTGCRGTINID